MCMTSDTLIHASGLTRQWVARIRALTPGAEFMEKKYWAPVRSLSTSRRVAQLNPRGTQVRVFLCLPPASQPGLAPSPSTKKWAERYPSVFFVRTEADVETAAELIQRALAFDLTR